MTRGAGEVYYLSGGLGMPSSPPADGPVGGSSGGADGPDVPDVPLEADESPGVVSGAGVSEPEPEPEPEAPEPEAPEPEAPESEAPARLWPRSSSRREPCRRRNVRCARARSRIATSSWEPVRSVCAPFPAEDPCAAGVASAASAAARASVSDMPSWKRSFSVAETWSAGPPKATKPG